MNELLKIIKDYEYTIDYYLDSGDNGDVYKIKDKFGNNKCLKITNDIHEVKFSFDIYLLNKEGYSFKYNMNYDKIINLKDGSFIIIMDYISTKNIKNEFDKLINYVNKINVDSDIFSIDENELFYLLDKKDNFNQMLRMFYDLKKAKNELENVNLNINDLHGNNIGFNGLNYLIFDQRTDDRLPIDGEELRSIISIELNNYDIEKSLIDWSKKMGFNDTEYEI